MVIWEHDHPYRRSSRDFAPYSNSTLAFCKVGLGRPRSARFQCVDEGTNAENSAPQAASIGSRQPPPRCHCWQFAEAPLQSCSMVWLSAQLSSSCDQGCSDANAYCRWHCCMAAALPLHSYGCWGSQCAQPGFNHPAGAAQSGAQCAPEWDSAGLDHQVTCGGASAAFRQPPGCSAQWQPALAHCAVPA